MLVLGCLIAKFCFCFVVVVGNRSLMQRASSLSEVWREKKGVGGTEHTAKTSIRSQRKDEK